MPKITVAVGLLLLIEGVGFYVGTSARSVTALIPSFVGLPILLLGLLAFKESLRMHVIHAAVLLATLGLAAAVWRMAAKGISLSTAGVSVLLMALLCGGYVVLCVKSFVDARIRRRKADLSKIG
jgi:uncharacterized membrane protein